MDSTHKSTTQLNNQVDNIGNMSNIVTFEQNGVPYNLHLDDSDKEELGRHIRERHDLIKREEVLKKRRCALEDRLILMGYRFGDHDRLTDPSYRAKVFDNQGTQIALNDIVMILTTGRAGTASEGVVVMIEDDWLTIEDDDGNYVNRKPHNVKVIGWRFK